MRRLTKQDIENIIGSTIEGHRVEAARTSLNWGRANSFLFPSATMRLIGRKACKQDGSYGVSEICAADHG